MEKITLKIARNGKFEEFSVVFDKEMTVLDALQEIKDRRDGALSFRWSCRMGICGSCGMMVNGKPVLTCQSYIKDYLPSITVGPLRHFPVIKDLVVDIDDPMEKFRKAMPWSSFQKNKTNNVIPRRQSPKDLKKISQTSQCVKCMLCYSACPVYGLDKGFLGPAAAALTYRRQMDSREEESSKKERIKKARIKNVSDKNGVWKCSFVGECSVVCPKRVDPALALQRLKIMGVKNIIGI